MGNQESKSASGTLAQSDKPVNNEIDASNSKANLESTASASGSTNVSHSDDKRVSAMNPKPIKISGSRAAIITASPVTGSPLGVLEQGSAGSSSWFGRNRLSYETNNILGSSPRTRKEYIQPAGEKDFKNTAKIVHGYGPSGLAPLTPLNQDKKEKTIPIMIVWPHPGKVVHLTGTFNNWKKKIRLQKR